MRYFRNISVAAAMCAALACAHADEKPIDNGTDPTKLSSMVSAKFERLGLKGGGRSDTWRLQYTLPFGERKDYSLSLKLPVARVTVAGDDRFDLGDASLMVSHVFGFTASHAFVVQGEAIFDTAGRPELGYGKQVFKGTLIYALFLEGGSIFAPAVVQSNSYAGGAGRANVNATTLDFYYVPKMADPRNLMTWDPALNFDWESNKHFASLAVTVGRVMGPALGGNGVLFLKPTIFAGGHRPASWGLEVGYKVIGF